MPTDFTTVLSFLGEQSFLLGISTMEVLISHSKIMEFKEQRFVSLLAWSYLAGRGSWVKPSWLQTFLLVREVNGGSTP